MLQGEAVYDPQGIMGETIGTLPAMSSGDGKTLSASGQGK